MIQETKASLPAEGDGSLTVKVASEAPSSFKKMIQYVVLATFCFIVLYFVMNSLFGSGDSRQIKEVNASVKSIQGKIDSINAGQNFLVERMYEMETRQLEFNDKLKENNKLLNRNFYELSKIKKMYNEKIRVVDHYNYSQLDSFFTNRYKTRK